MTEQPVIMIQVARRGWTINALYAACQMAKKVKGRIALVKMVPIQHFAWLGTELGYMDLTYEEEEEIEDYQELVEEYNVEIDVYLFQYTSMVNAIVQAVEHAQAQVLFATIPAALMPGWRNFQLYRLRQSLAKQPCELIETPHFDAGDALPSEWQQEEESLLEEMPLVFNPFEAKERV